MKFRDEFIKIEKEINQKDKTIKDKLIESRCIENNLNEQIEDQKYKFELLLKEYNKIKENPEVVQRNDRIKKNDIKIDMIDLKFDLDINENNESDNNMPQYKSILYILKELNIDSKIFYRKS